ncbi:MAG: hypothetical protein Q8O54_01480, partial [Brevundimonas sp.]|nr:hypothetical protein [Brevundimonas sp.]
MSLVWLALAAIAVWALVRLGRQTERRGRGHWRVTATLFSAVLIAGAVLLAARGSWLAAAALGGAGLWLTLSSRQRAPAPRTEAMSPAEARSLLGYYAQELGAHRLFDTLAELGDGVILDSRVLLAHANGQPSRADR